MWYCCGRCCCTVFVSAPDRSLSCGRSDPEDIETWQVSPRGAGWLFGYRVTNEFNRINRVDLIARAHQLVQEGYKVPSCASIPPMHLLTLCFCVFVVHVPRPESRHRMERAQLLLSLRVRPSFVLVLRASLCLCLSLFVCDRSRVTACSNVASILALDDKLNRDFKIFSAVPDDKRVIPARQAMPYVLTLRSFRSFLWFVGLLLTAPHSYFL